MDSVMIGLDDPATITMSWARSHRLPDSNLMLSAAPTAGKHLSAHSVRRADCAGGGSNALARITPAKDTMADRTTESRDQRPKRPQHSTFPGLPMKPPRSGSGPNL